jgi:hypothetical protein
MGFDDLVLKALFDEEALSAFETALLSRLLQINLYPGLVALEGCCNPCVHRCLIHISKRLHPDKPGLLRCLRIAKRRNTAVRNKFVGHVNAIESGRRASSLIAGRKVSLSRTVSFGKFPLDPVCPEYVPVWLVFMAGPDDVRTIAISAEVAGFLSDVIRGRSSTRTRNATEAEVAALVASGVLRED